MSFERPSITIIDRRIRADMEANMDAVPVVRRGSVLAGIARGQAGASHELHGHLNWNYRQLFPDTAESPALERQAGFYGIVRGAAAASSGVATITGDNGAILRAGAIMADEDGREYAVVADTVITGASGEAPVIASDMGAAGNLEPGARLVLLVASSGIDREAEVAAPGFAGGADTETDARLLQRLLLRLRKPPHGGAAHDYEAWALEVPGVTRVWPVSESIGAMTVRFVVDGAPHGPAPTAGEVAAVREYIEARRPVTVADITVSGPVLLPIDHRLRIVPDTAATRVAALDALRVLYLLEGEPGRVIPLTHVAEALSLAAGEYDHDLQLPAGDIVPLPGEMPVLGEVTFL